MTDLCGLPMLEVASPNLSRWDRFLKRSFDLTLATVTLVVLSPVLLAVALAVRLTSPGPILFRQDRLGRDQRAFRIYKFRTMFLHEERHDAAASAGADDGSTGPAQPLHLVRNKAAKAGQITSIGNFLRRSSLDELPQLFNVLRGDMSIVGPRPFIPAETELEGISARRFEVRPGITGLWQVSGRNELSGDDLRQLDYLYVASWSMWSDLKIVWDTPRTMVRGTGAF
jgi:lipopolysaccharide/colanic/teichoic acid biosynthesis glycosyltransferase